MKSTRSLDQNRRQGNRHRLQISATLIRDGSSPAEVPVTVIAISVGGLGFRSAQPLEIGGTYRVTSFDTLIPTDMRTLVVTQRQMPSGDFEVGGKTV